MTSDRIKALLAKHGLGKSEKAEPAQEPIDTSFLEQEVSASVSTSDKSIQIVELPVGTIDPRMQLLSHSSRTLLHTCPRKYQLYRLASEQVALESPKEVEQGVTFAYGKSVGIGIQSALENKSEERVILDTFLEWDVDLLDSNPRQNKSYWTAQFAVQKLYQMYQEGYLEDYELVYYNEKPAVELSFIVYLPNGYRYRGYLDGVLKHKITGEIVVLECKTTSGKAISAQYKNSGQAVGYSVVLDKMFPDLSSYTVLYLVYESRSYEFVQLPFEKSLLQRALWLQELLIDTQLIDTYHSYDTYPMYGESCYSFFRDCEYLGICTLSTENLVKPLTQEIVDNIAAAEDTSYDFNVSFEELVESQLNKGTE